MPYEYLDHIADVGLSATGDTLEAALQDAGQGLLDLQVDTTTIAARDHVAINATASDPAALLVTFLNSILAEQDINKSFFRTVRVHQVTEDANGLWTVTATLEGEPVDLTRHIVANEVKAATYSGLRADIAPGRVQLRCVLDI